MDMSGETAGRARVAPQPGPSGLWGMAQRIPAEAGAGATDTATSHGRFLHLWWAFARGTSVRNPSLASLASPSTALTVEGTIL